LRIGVIVVALAVSFLSAFFADAEPPAANARCPNPGPNRPDVENPGPNNLHWHVGGWHQPPATPGGVYAYIEVKQPWVEPTESDNFSSAWTLLAGGVHPQTGRGRYAQTGWIEWRNSSRNNFIAWTDIYGNQPFPRLYNPFSLNTRHYYTTLYDVNSGWFSYYIDGQFKDSMLLGWQPILVEVLAETDTAASQIAGGYNYPMWVIDIAVWYNGGWQRPTLNLLNDHWGYFGVVRFGSGGGQTLGIWDKYCPD